LLAPKTLLRFFDNLKTRISYGVLIIVVLIGCLPKIKCLAETNCLLHWSAFVFSLSCCSFADKREEYYKNMREQMKHVDKEDKVLDRQRRREKRIKEKMKRKIGSMGLEEDGEGEDDLSGSEGEGRKHKRSKLYFDSDSDYAEMTESKDNAGISTDSISLADQEALALKLLSSMHS
jgi:hypothetical protein